MLASSFGMAGDELKVMGRDYVYSCGYFSAMVGDYDVTFEDTTLPWGTKVTLIYGWDVEYWNHPPKYKSWSYREEKEMKSIAPYKWAVSLETQLHGRTSNEYKQALDLVVKLEIPGRPAPVYYNGGTKWGYFQTEVGNTSKAPCVDRDKKKPEMYQRLLKVVNKD